MLNNNNSIIVEDLHASINVTVLTRHFSSAGTVAKVDILRDLATLCPIGTAIVTFKANSTTDIAVTNLDGSKIFGRPCRVSRNPEGACPVEPVANPARVVSKLVAKSLVPEVPVLSGGDQQRSADAGDTLRLSLDLQASDLIAADESLGLAPEVMATKGGDMQTSVVESTNPAPEKPEAIVSSEAPARKSLYIRNISTDTTEDALRAMFVCYGPIVGVRLKMSKYVRGGVYVIVMYEDAQHAAQAVAALNGWKQESGEPLMVKLDLPRSVRRGMKAKCMVAPQRRCNVRVVERVPDVAVSTAMPVTKTVYIRNVPSDMTEDALRAMFSSAGAVVGVRLKQSKRVPGRVYAFVKYEDAQHAAQAVADLNGAQQESGESFTVKLNCRMKTKRKVARQAAVSGRSLGEAENQAPESSSASTEADAVVDLLSGAEVSGGEGSTQPEPDLKAAMVVEVATTTMNVGRAYEVVAA
jgi:RNA recognition motif-containing protein